MPKGLRLRGEQVDVHVLQNNALVKVVTAFKSCEVTPRIEVKEEEFLGETTIRVDDIFKGASFRLEGQLDNSDMGDLIKNIIGRAQRKPADKSKRFDITFICKFPNGDVRRITMADVVFEDMPINTGGRGEYSTLTLAGRSASFDII